jgi:hypothetical protein
MWVVTLENNHAVHMNPLSRNIKGSGNMQSFIGTAMPKHKQVWLWHIVHDRERTLKNL